MNNLGTSLERAAQGAGLRYIRPMRTALLAAAFVLLAAACGGGGQSAPSSGDTPADTAAVAATTPSESSSPDGPIAPDFTTLLSDGSEFSLAAQDKPVYMVFWAEW